MTSILAKDSGSENVHMNISSPSSQQIWTLSGTEIKHGYRKNQLLFQCIFSIHVDFLREQDAGEWQAEHSKHFISEYDTCTRVKCERVAL